MNLNNNPTKAELQALIEACDDGAGVHVLWVERRGEVQITLLLTETDVDWIKTIDDDKVQFHYKSYGKNEGFVGKAAATDDLYIVTLFEKLLRDWQEQVSGAIDAQIKRGTNASLETADASIKLQRTNFVMRRMRALENKFWLEAMLLADLHIETQLRTIAGLEVSQRSKLTRTGREVVTLAKQLHAKKQINQELYEKIKTFHKARTKALQNFIMETITYEDLETMALASESLIVELNELETLVSSRKDNNRKN